MANTPTPLSARQISALVAVAAYDYANARGTIHKNQLSKARSQIIQKYHVINKQLNSLNVELERVHQMVMADVENALHIYLVVYHLDEIPGIGPILQQVLITHVFHNRINDLNKAFHYSGFGEAKQHAINMWVKHYEAQIPNLMDSDFPGKQEVIDGAAPKINSIRENIDQAKLQMNKLAEYINMIDKALKFLNRISQRDFVQALTLENHTIDILDSYIKGIYGEWEQPPAWFEEVIKAGG